MFALGPACRQKEKEGAGVAGAWIGSANDEVAN
jgi:hypothetical protein